jgi:hypothetical protein
MMGTEALAKDRQRGAPNRIALCRRRLLDLRLPVEAVTQTFAILAKGSL